MTVDTENNVSASASAVGPACAAITIEGNAAPSTSRATQSDGSYYRQLPS